jgi:hypothetical protein
MIIEGERFAGDAATVAQAVEVLGDRWQADLDEAQARAALWKESAKDNRKRLHLAGQRLQLEWDVIDQIQAENADLRGRLLRSEQRIIELQVEAAGRLAEVVGG